MTIDQKINNLKAGESVRISEYNGIIVTVERSGNGKQVRFVRTSGDTQVVFQVAKF